MRGALDFLCKKIKKNVDKHLYFWYTIQATFGEVSEWFKEPVLKTGDSERGRGFESHLLRFELQLDTSEYRFWIQLEKYPSG